jgi:hypothetical protein
VILSTRFKKRKRFSRFNMNVETIVETAIENLNRIGIPIEYIRINTAPKHDGTPYIEVTDEGRFRYAFSDEDSVHDERITRDLNDILFWIYSDVTLKYACDCIKNHRMHGKNYQIDLIQKQLDLLGLIKIEYADRKRKKYSRIFDDIHPEINDTPSTQLK